MRVGSPFLPRHVETTRSEVWSRPRFLSARRYAAGSMTITGERGKGQGSDHGRRRVRPGAGDPSVGDNEERPNGGIAFQRERCRRPVPSTTCWRPSTTWMTGIR